MGLELTDPPYKTRRRQQRSNSEHYFFSDDGMQKFTKVVYMMWCFARVTNSEGVISFSLMSRNTKRIIMTKTQYYKTVKKYII